MRYRSVRLKHLGKAPLGDLANKDFNLGAPPRRMNCQSLFATHCSKIVGWGLRAKVNEQLLTLILVSSLFEKTHGKSAEVG
jgi:hypothetical protein